MDIREFRKKIEELVLERPAPGKHAARSALRHIQKAWLLREIDPEMAIFRSITAEEESATAVFHSVRRLRYSNADKLQPRNHVHKTALHPFLRAVGKFMDEQKVSEFHPTIEIDAKETPRRLKLRFIVSRTPDDEQYAYPIPPLNMKLDLNGKPYDFGAELQALASQRGAKDADTYIRQLANRRNQVLYAASNGIPSAEGDISPFLTYRETVVYQNLTVFLLVDQYPEHQLFVEQAISSFLCLLGLLHTPQEEGGHEPEAAAPVTPLGG